MLFFCKLSKFYKLKKERKKFEKLRYKIQKVFFFFESWGDREWRIRTGWRWSLFRVWSETIKGTQKGGIAESGAEDVVQEEQESQAETTKYPSSFALKEEVKLETRKGGWSLVYFNHPLLIPASLLFCSSFLFKKKSHKNKNYC